MTAEIESFFAEEAAFDRGPATAARTIHWGFSLTGDPALQEKMRVANLAVREHYADGERFARLSAWRESGVTASDPTLNRLLNVYWRDYLSAQEDAETRSNLVRLSSEQSGLFNRFRATLDGKEWSENDLNDALASVTDSDRVRAVWEAAKQIGVEAEPRALELVRLRNQSARSQGFRDAYQRGLAQSEVDEDQLFSLLNQLEAASDAPFRVAKADLDAGLAERFGIAVSDLRPWHYGDPFFQRPLRSSGPDLDDYFADKDPEALAIAACDSIDLDVRPILSRSSLYPQPGKNQHAFCMPVLPDGSDVRILCNLTKSHHWTGVLLHELGHAVAAEYADRSLPQRLTLWPNGIIAETESQIVERMSSDPAWLRDVVGLPADKAAAVAGELRSIDRLANLIMTRWSLVMAHFERALYANPDGDLRTLWWDLVERIQLVPRPKGRQAPDWASKIHLANFPGNYYVYIVGELVVSQLHNALIKEVGGLYGHPKAGQFLRERLFYLGAQSDWATTVQQATGSAIGVEAYVDEWFGA